MSTQPPSEKASELINKLPSQPGFVSKTGTAILGSGLIAAAISQELYVFNEETVILAGYAILFAYIGKVSYRVLFVTWTVLWVVGNGWNATARVSETRDARAQNRRKRC